MNSFRLCAVAALLLCSAFEATASVEEQIESISSELDALMAQIQSSNSRKLKTAVPCDPPVVSPSPPPPTISYPPIAVGNPSPVAVGNPSPCPSPVAVGNPSPCPSPVAVGNPSPCPSPVAVGNPSPCPSPVSVSTPSPVATPSPCPSPVSVSTPSPVAVSTPSPVATPSPCPSPVAVSTPSPVAVSTPSPCASPVPSPPVSVSVPSPDICPPCPICNCTAVCAAPPPPAKGPYCGTLSRRTLVNNAFVRTNKHIYCKPTESCCEVPISWKKQSTGPLSDPKTTTTEVACFDVCPIWAA